MSMAGLEAEPSRFHTGGNRERWDSGMKNWASKILGFPCYCDLGHWQKKKKNLLPGTADLLQPRQEMLRCTKAFSQPHVNLSGLLISLCYFRWKSWHFPRGLGSLFVITIVVKRGKNSWICKSGRWENTRSVLISAFVQRNCIFPEHPERECPWILWMWFPIFNLEVITDSLLFLLFWLP